MPSTLASTSSHIPWYSYHLLIGRSSNALCSMRRGLRTAFSSTSLPSPPLSTHRYVPPLFCSAKLGPCPCPLRSRSDFVDASLFAGAHFIIGLRSECPTASVPSRFAVDVHWLFLASRSFVLCARATVAPAKSSAPCAV
eukprot:6205184-Pleurochrysis_carterae.AAC.5